MKDRQVSPAGISIMDYRRNADTYPPADAQAFSAALLKMQQTHDNRGYSHFAGLHGWPGGLCKHHVPLFLPWHRAYLYMFEMSLRDLAGDIRLPWWDWTSKTSHVTGVPAMFAAYPPLQSAEIPLDAATQQAVRTQVPYAADLSGQVPKTIRHADPSDRLPSVAAVDEILDASTFNDFTSRLEDIHDAVHYWFQGSMTIVPLAAYDPIFWAHHAMIDRLWYLWQLRHPNAPLTGIALDHALEGFPLNVRQVLDVAALGYDYSVEVVS